MLKGIHPLLNPELLKVLAEMGHGDELVIADANFPSATIASSSIHGKTLRVDCSSPVALNAILSVFPLDSYEPDPVLSMQVVGDAEAIPEVVAEVLPLIALQGFSSKAIERFAFYERARGCYAVLQTNELRLYGNFIIRKGVIFPLT